MGESDSALDPDSGIVRAAMHHGIAHLEQKLPIDVASVKIHDSGNATHEAMGWRRRQEADQGASCQPRSRCNIQSTQIRSAPIAEAAGARRDWIPAG